LPLIDNLRRLANASPAVEIPSDIED
jgi:hypothetical protein